MTLPSFRYVTQRVYLSPLADLPAHVLAELERVLPPFPAGAEVAVTAGSRGVANIGVILRAACQAIRARGGQPFIVPAMGSHGGATAAGLHPILLDPYDDHAGADFTRIRSLAELAARPPRLLEATTNRDAQLAMLDSPAAAEFMCTLAAGGMDLDVDRIRQAILTGDDGQPIGVAESEIAWAIDLPADVIELKRRAMQCHASQTSDIGMMLAFPPDIYAVAFGTEYLIDPGAGGAGADAPMRHGWPFG